MASPYRADHVGSLLRPPELLQAREEHRQGRLTAAELRQAEDAAIFKALDLQREVGISVFTEGEYRRSGWSTSIRDSVEGLVPTEGSPIQGFLGQCAIGSIIRHALHRTRIVAPTTGAHQFRHALATRMLRRGASLTEIGEILRHRSPQTTMVYAKVDLPALRTLALPWPGGAQ